jgi:glycosyltransferase involved in cell wall biosynthesis
VSTSEPRITCCIFAWNEVHTLGRVVEEHLGELDRLGVSYELVIIDDGSSDGTSALADQIAATHPRIRVLHHGDNRGLGGVYRTGFSESRGTFVTFFPADGQFPASILPTYYPLVEDWDVVLGIRPGRRDTVKGAVLGALERALYRMAVGPMPRLEGVFILRRTMLAELPLKSTGRGWTVVWELLLRAHRKGYRMIERPNILRPRTHGESKVNNLRNITANLRALFALRRLLDD